MNRNAEVKENKLLSLATNFLREYPVIIMLILLCAAFTIGNPAFIKPVNLITILLQVSMLGVGSLGVMVVMLVGGVNFAVGASVGMTSIWVAMLIVWYSVPWPLAMIISLIASMIMGWLMGFIIVKTGINQLVASLAFRTIIRGTAFTICGGLPIYGIPAESKIFGQGRIFNFIPIPVVIFVCAALVIAFILNKTYYGRNLFATGANIEAARLSGINTGRTKIIAYTICGMLGAIAGVVMYGRIGSGQPDGGVEIEMNVISAVVIGGVSLQGGEGKVFKACCGVVLIGVISNGLTLNNVNEYLKLIVQGLIFLVAVIVDMFQHRERKVRIDEVEEAAAA